MCLLDLIAVIILAFWSGDNFAKIFTSITLFFNSSSDILIISDPNKIVLDSMPTMSQTYFVTVSLSPVNTLTITPFLTKPWIASLADGLGGSSKAINPIKHISFSSAILNGWSFGKLFLLIQIAITLIPSAFNWETIDFACSISSLDNGTTWPLYSQCEQIWIISSNAPLVTNCSPVSFPLTITDILLRWKSNGISSIFVNPEIGLSIPLLFALSITAISIKFFKPVW